MKKFFSFGPALLVIAMLVGVFAWSLHPTPDGEVVITDLNDGSEVSLASR